MGDAIGGWQPQPGIGTTPSQTAGVTDVVTQLQGIVRQLTALVKATNGGSRAFGSFQTTASATAVVAQPAVQANSFIQLEATNASASTLVQAHGYFITNTAGTGFTVTFGAAAAGTETFNYLVNTPI